MKPPKEILILNDAIDAVIKLFEKKQGLKFEFWVGDEIGGTACYSDYYLYFGDIVTDIRENATKGAILNWQDQFIELHYRGQQTINYKTFLKTLQ